MQGRHLLAIFCVLVGLVCAQAARTLSQSGGCASSPGNPVPEECSGGVFSGNQWDNDEIECNFGGRQLKCDLDEDLIGDNDIECELEGPGNDIEFDCNVDSNCNVVCGPELAQIIPAEYYSTVKSILDAWKPAD